VRVIYWQMTGDKTDFRGFEIAQQDLRAGNIAPLALQEVVIGEFRLRRENLLGNGHYHSDWVSNADKVRVIYWQMTGDKTAAASSKSPSRICARAILRHWLCRKWLLANSGFGVWRSLNENARSLRLMSDLNRNLLLLNQLYWQAGRKSEAQKVFSWISWRSCWAIASPSITK
jgi:hypothetical protein